MTGTELEQVAAFIPPGSGRYLFHVRARAGSEEDLPYVEGMRVDREPYTEQTLAAALRRKLSPAELGLVANPLASTPEMRRWAQELTKGATNDLHKARMLFDALARRLEALRGAL